MRNSRSFSKICRPFLAIFCSLLLAVALFPMSVLAEEAYGEESVEVGSQEDVDTSTYDEGLDLTPEEALEADHVPGELVVVYKSDIPSMTEELPSQNGNPVTLEDASVVQQEEIGDLPDDKKASLVTLGDDSNETMVAAIERLSSAEDVAYVEPNFLYTTSNTVPNDTYATASYQYYLESAGVTSMWDTAKTEGDVSVAVIDSGCNFEHDDLKDRIDRANAYDVISGKKLVSAGVANNGDSFGHGTNVCGVIAAEANNGFGIAGTSWNAKLIPIRIFDQNNETDSYALIDALQYVDDLIEDGKADNLRVLNMSLGGPGNSRSVRDLLDHLYIKHGVLNVCAGGNGDRNNKPITDYTYPSDYNSCIGVTSTSKAGANSTWCDYNDAKDLSAPGEWIWTTTVGGSWSDRTAPTAPISGTSFSAPLVAGVAAAMFAKYPSASAYDVVKAMQATAKSFSGKPRASGSAGVLSAGDAVSYLATHITGKNPSSGLGTVTNYRSNSIPMYRLYNRVTGEHLYTASAYERDVLARGDWNYEGIGWYAPRSGDPVYRLWNGNVGEHHYTTSAYERDYIVRYQGWTYEGIGWYSSGSTPLYRLYNPDWNMHHYTTSTYERDYIARYQGWNKEGIGWYGL